MNDSDSPSGEERSKAEGLATAAVPRYFGDSYCCPACGTAFTLIRKEITGAGEGRSILHCPADNAVRVSDEELFLLTGYIRLRSEARDLIRQRTAERGTK